MQRKILFFITMLISSMGMAQTTDSVTMTRDRQDQKVVNLLSKIDSLLIINNILLEHLEINSSLKVRYK